MREWRACHEFEWMHCFQNCKQGKQGLLLKTAICPYLFLNNYTVLTWSLVKQLKVQTQDTFGKL